MHHRGKELVLRAMQKEYRLLLRKHKQAKAEYEECSKATGELIAISKAKMEIALSNKSASQALREISKLDKDRARWEKAMDKDLIKLMDREIDAEMDCRELGREIDSFITLNEIRGYTFKKKGAQKK